MCSYLTANSLCVQVLLERPAVDVQHVNTAGKTALHLAASSGEHTLVRPLLAAGVPVDTLDSTGNSALISAADANNQRFALDLLSVSCADVNARGDADRTCLHWAGYHGMARMATALLCRSGTEKELRDEHGDTAAILATKMSHAEVASLMLVAGCDAAARGALGRTAMHWAAVHGMCGVLQAAAPFLSRETLNAKDDDGNTVVLCSAIHRRYRVMVFLLQRYGDIDVSVRGEQGRTALHWVSADGALDIVRLLLGHATVDVRDESGDTPLILACRHGHASSARQLVVGGSDANARGRGGRCALHHACATGMTSTVQMLLEFNADYDAVDGDANSPLLLAAAAGSDDAIVLLVRAGCHVNAVGAGCMTALCHVADHCSVHTVRLLLDAGALPDGDDSADPPLVCAATHGHVYLVQALLAHGARTGRVDRHGRTALLWAARGGSVDIVKALIAHGADW